MLFNFSSLDISQLLWVIPVIYQTCWEDGTPNFFFHFMNSNKFLKVLFIFWKNKVFFLTRNGHMIISVNQKTSVPICEKRHLSLLNMDWSTDVSWLPAVYQWIEDESFGLHIQYALFLSTHSIQCKIKMGEQGILNMDFSSKNKNANKQLI